MLWAAWAEEWALAEPVSFDGRNRAIVVNAGVEALSISRVYSAWKRWMQREQNAMYLPAIRATGGDPIPGGSTGTTYLLQNGWRLYYDPTIVAVQGVLYSEDYETAYYALNGRPVYPATVSSVVNNVTSTANIITGDLGSLVIPSAAEIVAAILAAAQADPIHAATQNLDETAAALWGYRRD